ncbi:MAG: phosphatidylserine decarboxylase family protein, partial [Candidatus Binatia bacterium]
AQSRQHIMKKGCCRIAREGFPFIGLFLALTVAGYFLFWPAAVAFGALTLFSLNFFRDPERLPPEGEDLLVSPADGTVLKIEFQPGGRYLNEPHQKISIFMSALDVHVNRIPCHGTVERIHYHPGNFFVASLDKASEKNERNSVVVRTPRGDAVAFVQIAGLVARRIVCYLKEGMTARRGERYGMIRFGSRMELCFPPQWPVLVKAGQKVKAGTTPLVRMKQES